LENPDTINRIPFFKQHWVIPILLAILVLPILILLPWHNQKMEFEERQDQLIADTLWVGQGIQSRMSKDEDYIKFLGEDVATGRFTTEQIERRFSTFLETHNEFQQLIWLNAQGQILYASQPISLDDFSPDSRQTISDARTSSMPQYSDPAVMRGHGTDVLMDYHFPLFSDQSGEQNGEKKGEKKGEPEKKGEKKGEPKYLGSIVVSYKLSAILQDAVPWWFAKDNEISIVDIDDRVVAVRADGGPGLNVFTHSRSLDLPGVSLMLKTNSINNSPKLLSNVLVLTVIVLALGLSWSLWELWRDVLRRQAVETALQAQVAFRKAMEKSLVTGLRVRSMDGHLVYVNPAFCAMVGLTEQELIGQKMPFSFWTQAAYEAFGADLPMAEIPVVHNGFETVYQHAAGHEFPVSIYESPLVDENGLQTGWMGSILDISERKKTELTLRQSEDKLQRSARLATMGELASMMAHELNQPLTAINTYASGILNMMKSGKVESDELIPALDQMQKQAVRAATIIRSVHDFVVKRGPNRTQRQFSEVFNAVLPLIQMQAKTYLISLKFDVETALPDVLIDPISIEQVILNLTRNALHAMHDLPMKQRVLHITASRKGNQVQVEVIDNGAGITEEVAERLFSPFFSTKAEGMGMGLNICRTIIEFHGGQLNYLPNPSGGTIFSFTVPVASHGSVQTELI